MSSSPSLESLLGRGYFPRELPPPFCTESFGKYAQSLRPGSLLPFDTSSDGSRTSKPEIYNLARAGSFRRELSILNPIHFATLAECVVQNWDQLQKHTRSRLSLTTPTVQTVGRALARASDLEILPTKRAEVRSAGRYLLQADISRFYPSIYTHSIAWAIHGKAFAKDKRNRGHQHLGNKLDALVSKCQDAQTNGIPVGPDTSLLIAEILLAQVDRKLIRKRAKGFRYMDDYELIFENEQKAFQARSVLQEALLDFELHLAANKTFIHALPTNLEDNWVVTLNRFSLIEFSDSFPRQIIRFFDRAFEFAKAHPQEGVLKYAAGRISKLRIPSKHSSLVENLLMQCARVEAGALSLVLAAMLKTPANTIAHNKARRDLLLDLIDVHAPQRHSSEVAWALWASVVMRIKIPSRVVKVVIGMEDSICALLVLHARRLRLLEDPSSVLPLRDAMSAKTLYESRWLLAYEANVKGWFQFRGAKDYVTADSNFKHLKAAGVSFYDVSRTAIPDSEKEATRSEAVDDYLARIAIDYGDDEGDDDDDDDDNEGRDHADSDGTQKVAWSPPWRQPGVNPVPEKPFLPTE